MPKTIVTAAASALLIGTAAGAQAVATSTKTATTTSKPAMSNKATQAVKQRSTTAANDGHGHMATHTTTTGKKITHDCRKAGNRNKTARGK